MLQGKELKMYKASNCNIRLTLNNGEVLQGFCSEFSSAYDNDPEEASITLKNPVREAKGEILYLFTEIMEHEIKEIEVLGE